MLLKARMAAARIPWRSTQSIVLRIKETIDDPIKANIVCSLPDWENAFTDWKWIHNVNGKVTNIITMQRKRTPQRKPFCSTSLCLAISVYVCLSVWLTVCLPVSVFVCFCIYLSVSLSLSPSLSLSLSLSLKNWSHDVPYCVIPFTQEHQTISGARSYFSNGFLHNLFFLFFLSLLFILCKEQDILSLSFYLLAGT